MSEAWLKCRIDNYEAGGQLSIMLRGVQGQTVSLFCSDRYIDVARSTLLVDVLRRREKVALVRLPDQSFNGTTILDVPCDSLIEAMQLA